MVVTVKSYCVSTLLFGRLPNPEHLDMQIRTQVHCRSQAQANFFLIQALIFFNIFVYSSWRPPSLFLQRKPFTHEARRCDLSIIPNRYGTLYHKVWWAGKIPRGMLEVARVPGWVSRGKFLGAAVTHLEYCTSPFSSGLQLTQATGLHRLRRCNVARELGTFRSSRGECVWLLVSVREDWHPISISLSDSRMKF